GARDALRGLASAHGLCWKALGLERREGPCFARQLKRCAGACVGAETSLAHQERLRRALHRHAMRPWPYRGAIGLRETDLLGTRTDIHVFRDWCWLGTARDAAMLAEIVQGTTRVDFDLDIYRLLARRLPRMHPILLERSAISQLAAVSYREEFPGAARV